MKAADGVSPPSNRYRTVFHQYCGVMILAIGNHAYGRGKRDSIGKVMALVATAELVSRVVDRYLPTANLGQQFRQILRRNRLRALIIGIAIELMKR